MDWGWGEGVGGEGGVAVEWDGLLELAGRSCDRIES